MTHTGPEVAERPARTLGREDLPLQIRNNKVRGNVHIPLPEGPRIAQTRPAFTEPRKKEIDRKKEREKMRCVWYVISNPKYSSAHVFLY